MLKLNWICLTEDTEEICTKIRIKNAVLSQKIILAKHELTNQYLANAEAVIQNPLNVLLM